MRQPAFSLIEVLSVVSLLTLSLLYFSPIHFQVNSISTLQTEISQFKAFFYRLQNRAGLYRYSYSLTISQNGDRWCAIAAKKEPQQVKCDCFQASSCQAQEFFVYQPYYKSVNLKSNSFYPQTFLELSGDSGNSSVKCLQFFTEQNQRILKFDRGFIAEYPEKNRSKCNDI
jgi:hypothetical protein